jgi:putative flippase GtrA
MVSRQFLLFVAASGAAAVVNVVARYLIGLALPYGWSIVLAFFCGLLTAFVLSRRFVFEAHAGDHGRQALRFTLVNLVALIQVWGVSELLVRLVFPRLGMVWQPETVAHVIGVASPIATSYLGHKHFSFAGGPSAPP